MTFEVSNVSFHYTSKKKPTNSSKNPGQIQNLSFSVEVGSLCGLVGPNGSGKSTFLSVCCGLLAAESGSVNFCGISFLESSFRANMGVVFQNPSLDSKLTILQNLDVAATLVGLTGQNKELRIQWALDFSELVERKNEKVGALSGGLKRRLDIARAFLHEPKLLLLDEPSAGLDEYSFRKMWNSLEKLRLEKQVTILVSTHKPEEAEKCSQIVVISRGKIVDVTTPEKLRKLASKEVIDLRIDGYLEPKKSVLSALGSVNILEKNVRFISESESDLSLEIELEENQFGPSFVPKVFEVLKKQSVKSLSIRQANLGDAFAKLAGESLYLDQN